MESGKLILCLLFIKTEAKAHEVMCTRNYSHPFILKEIGRFIFLRLVSVSISLHVAH